MTSVLALESPGFRQRLAKSERMHLALVSLVLLVLLLNVILRRALGGIVMSADAVFHPTVGVLLGGLAFQGLVLLWLRHTERKGTATPARASDWTLLTELLVPTSLMLILQNHSPRGEYAALSAPVLLLMPIVILLSVLRLRPWLSFGTGLVAGGFHVALVIRAFQRTDIPREHVPVLFSYGLLLVLTGVAAAAVAWMARRYVVEAASEATAAEQASKAKALVERELQVAHDIQMGLLPKDPPNLSSFDIAGMCRPAARAGGDYFDWQPLPDGRLVVVIADVSGHGVGPALVTAVCRAYARATVPSTPDAGELLQVLNRLICEDVKGLRFITMYVLVLAADGGVQMLSAGHGPTLLYRAGEERVESFGGDGLPLGIFEGATYGPLREVRMAPGDVLLLSTDGFFEYARAGDAEQFGEERMQGVLVSNAAQSATDLIASLDRAVLQFAGGAPQEDDMTAVAIRRLPVGSGGGAGA